MRACLSCVFRLDLCLECVREQGLLWAITVSPRIYTYDLNPRGSLTIATRTLTKLIFDLRTMHVECISPD